MNTYNITVETIIVHQSLITSVNMIAERDDDDVQFNIDLDAESNTLSFYVEDEECQPYFESIVITDNLIENIKLNFCDALIKHNVLERMKTEVFDLPQFSVTA
jgi:hypothetical protein